jgi:hypothetical protein
MNLHSAIDAGEEDAVPSRRMFVWARNGERYTQTYSSFGREV